MCLFYITYFIYNYKEYCGKINISIYLKLNYKLIIYIAMYCISL